MRFLILVALLLVTPLFIYRVYVRYVVRQKAEKGMGWNEGPVTWLMIAGFALAIAAVAIWGLTMDRDGKGPYTPAQFENGELIPGSIGDAPEEDE